VKDVVSVQHGFERRADAIRGQADLSAAQRTAALEALAAEATHQLTAKLGEKTFNAYQEYSGWLTRLQPAATETKSP
jgi:hypothetical protein